MATATRNDVSQLGQLAAASGLKLFCFRAGGAAQDYDYPDTIDGQYQVLDVWTINTTGTGGACTITVKNSATSITDAIDINKADATVTRATTISDADGAGLLQDGDTLRATSSAAEDTCLVCVLAVRYQW